jgi:hypothetical protein
MHALVDNIGLRCSGTIQRGTWAGRLAQWQLALRSSPQTSRSQGTVPCPFFDWELRDTSTIPLWCLLNTQAGCLKIGHQCDVVNLSSLLLVMATAAASPCIALLAPSSPILRLSVQFFFLSRERCTWPLGLENWSFWRASEYNFTRLRIFLMPLLSKLSIPS